MLYKRHDFIGLDLSLPSPPPFNYVGVCGSSKLITSALKECYLFEEQIAVRSECEYYHTLI